MGRERLEVVRRAVVDLRAVLHPELVGTVWRSSAAGKALVVSVAAICAAAALYAAYLVLFGG